MVNVIKCDTCKTDLKKGMAISHSSVTQEYYCSDPCESLGMINYCQPTRIDFDDKDTLDYLGIITYRNKLVEKD